MRRLVSPFRRALGVLGAVFLASCGDAHDGMTAPDNSPMRIALNTTASLSAPADIEATISYQRRDSSRVELVRRTATVTPGQSAATTLALTLDLAVCLGDANRAGSQSACDARLVVRLVRGTTVLDEVARALTLQSASEVSAGDPVALYEVTRVAVNPPPTGSATWVEVGERQTLAASAFDKTGALVTSRAIRWRSLTPAVARIDSLSGEIEGVTPGQVTFEAAAGERRATVSYTVRRESVRELRLTPSDTTVLAGRAVQYAVQLVGRRGGILTGSDAEGIAVTATSSDQTVATISGAYLASTRAPGSTVLTFRTTAGRDGAVVSASRSLAVQPVPFLTASTDTVRFVVETNGESAPTTVSIGAGGGGPQSGVTATIAYEGSTGIGWLQARLSGSTTPATLELLARPTNLGPGNYVARVTMAAANPDVTPVTVRVFLRVPVPVITASPRSLIFSGSLDRPLPSAQTVQLSGANAGGVTATQVGGSDLEVLLDRGTLPATLSIRPTALPPANTTVQRLVRVSSTVGSVVEIPVTLGTEPPAGLVLSATTVNVGLVDSASVASAPSVGLSASITGRQLTGLGVTVAYVTSTPINWLDARLDGTSTPASLLLNVRTVGLPSGTYQARATIASTLAGVAPVTVTVSMEVASLPEITTSSSTLTFRGSGDQVLPNGLTVQLAGVNAGRLAVGEVGGDGLELSLSRDSLPATLFIRPLLMPSPNVTVNRTVRVSGSRGISRDIAVQVIGVPVAQFAVGSSAVAFGGLDSGTTSSSSVTVGATLPGRTLRGVSPTIAYTSSTPINWLDARLDASSTPTVLRLTANTVGLPSGVNYTAQVTLQSTVLGVTPVVINVSMTNQRPPTIVLSSQTVNITAVQGNPLPAPQTITLTNSGASPLTGLSLVLPPSGVTAVLNGTSAPTTISVSATSIPPTGATSNYSVVVISSNPLVQPRGFTVNVSGSGTFTISPDTVDFGLLDIAGLNTQRSATINLATTNFAVFGTVQANVGYVAGATGWLPAPNTTSAPGSTQISPVTGTLPNGLYQGIVNFFSFGVAVPATVDATVYMRVVRPVSLGGQSPVLIATGQSHACATEGSGRVWCWGSNTFNQLGTTTPSSASPVAVTPNITATALALGNTHSCAILSGGPVACWGEDYGAIPQVLPPGPGFRAIAAGNRLTCGIDVNDIPYCWGVNGFGQLGNGTTTNSGTPVQVQPTNLRAQNIVVGAEHACILDFGLQVWCWGRDDGRLGRASSTSALSSIAVQNGEIAQVLAAGSDHTCTVRFTGLGPGGVFCWGLNGAGQLGNGTSVTNPQAFIGLVQNSITLQLDEIALGGNTSCGRNSSLGSVYCWGANGAISPRPVSFFTSPTRINFGSVSPLQIKAAGSIALCARANSATIWCWGNPLLQGN